MKGKTWKLKHMNQLKNNDMSFLKKHMEMLTVVGTVVAAMTTIIYSNISVVNSLRTEMREDMRELRTEMREGFAKMDAKFDAKFAESDKRWYELLNQFHNHDKDIERLKK
jgi:hypothetical protein